VERGTHRDLVTQNGLYRGLWDLQNRILFEENKLSLVGVE
jgi:hypothetical protein